MIASSFDNIIFQTNFLKKNSARIYNLMSPSCPQWIKDMVVGRIWWTVLDDRALIYFIFVRPVLKV